MTKPAPPVVLTMGDPAGVGPEIALKAWAERRDSGQPFLIIGDPEHMRRVAVHGRLPPPITIDTAHAARAVFPKALPILPLDTPLAAPVTAGQGDPANGEAVIASIRRAVALTLAGETGGVVTNPISKSVLYEAGFSHPGHTEFIADLTAQAEMDGPRGPIMMLACEGLRVALVTIHTALADAPAAATPERIMQTARVVDQALKRDFGIESPRLALAGLNPHAGEGGAMGREEIDTINPAAAVLRADGLDISDARPADTLFHADARSGYDAAICLYHDQGLIPVKTLDFHGAVNLTLGLPIIRTSPDHGTAFDIAGKGLARADSLSAAISMASDMAERRALSGPNSEGAA